MSAEAREGSQSYMARFRLGLRSDLTLPKRVRVLERSVGVVLLHRTSRGLIVASRRRALLREIAQVPWARSAFVVIWENHGHPAGALFAALRFSGLGEGNAPRNRS